MSLARARELDDMAWLNPAWRAPPARFTLIRELELGPETFDGLDGAAERIEQLRGGRGLSAVPTLASYGGSDTFEGLNVYATHRQTAEAEWLGLVVLPHASAASALAQRRRRACRPRPFGTKTTPTRRSSLSPPCPGRLSWRPPDARPDPPWMGACRRPRHLRRRVDGHPVELHMSALSPAVLDNGDVLRRFADARPIGSVPELAREFGRDLSNFKRTVSRLAEAGAIRTPDAGGAPEITAEGRRAIQALDLAEGKITVPEGYVALHHSQIFPDVLNPRSDFDSPEHHEALGELMSDILQNGLLQNLLVRPAEPSEYVRLVGSDGAELPMFRLISGERRWRAIGNLIHYGDWPADRPIPCQVIDVDDMGHSLRALAENLQRRALSPIEEAKAFKRLVDGGMSTDELADRVSVTQRQVQMRIQLLELSDDDQARMELPKDDPEHLTVTGARQLIQQPKTAPSAGPVPPALGPMSVEEDTALFELTHKASHLPVSFDDNRPGTWVYNDGYCYMSDVSRSLKGRGLVEDATGEIAGRYSCATRLTDAGADYVRSAFYAAGVTDETLATVQARAMAERPTLHFKSSYGCENIYLTSWLNTPHKDRGADGLTAEERRVAAEPQTREAQQRSAELTSRPAPPPAPAPVAPSKSTSQAERDVDMADRFASRLKLRLIDRRASGGAPLIGPETLSLQEIARLAVRAFHKADVDGLGVALAALCATPHFASSPGQLLASAASDWDFEQAERRGAEADG